MVVEPRRQRVQRPKSANFYKKRKRLPKAVITELFRAIRQNSDSPSQNVFHHVKQPLIDQNIESSTFIRAFARPIDLNSMPAGVLPTYIAIDVPTLTEQIFDELDGMRLVRRIGDDAVVLEKNEVDAILALLDRTLTVGRVRGKLRITDPQNRQIGTLNIGKTRISLRSFEIPEIEDIYIEPVNPPAGEDDQGVLIKRYIDQNDLYTILFSDLAVVYLDGALEMRPFPIARSERLLGSRFCDTESWMVRGQILKIRF
jgi:hypothetical protein